MPAALWPRGPRHWADSGGTGAHDQGGGPDLGRRLGARSGERVCTGIALAAPYGCDSVGVSPMISLMNLLDHELEEAQTRMGVRFPAPFLAFIRTHTGRAHPASEGHPEAGGLWLPPAFMGQSLDFDLADFPCLEEEDTAGMERLIVIRMSEEGETFMTLDYRHGNEPEVRFFLYEDEHPEEQLVFERFEQFQAALLDDPQWANPFLANDGAMATRMLGN